VRDGARRAGSREVSDAGYVVRDARPSRASEQARALARLLDSAVRIPGTSVRVGLDPILGLLPGAGDLIAGALSAYVLLLAARSGVSKPVLLRMLGNLGADAVVGSVPLVGDLFDVGFKANARNVRLLEEYHARPRTTERASGLFVGAIVAAALLLAAATITGAVLLVRWLAAAAG
jgi:hypothetical protein